MKRNHIIFGICLAVMAVVVLVYAWQELDRQVPKKPVSSATDSSSVPSADSSSATSSISSVKEIDTVFSDGTTDPDSMYRVVHRMEALPLPDMEQSPVETNHKAVYTVHDVYISKELPEEFADPYHVAVRNCELDENRKILNEYSYLFIDMTIDEVNFSFSYDLSWPQPNFYIDDKWHSCGELASMNVNQERAGKKDYWQFLIDGSLRYTVVYVFEDIELEQADHFILTIATGTPYDVRTTTTGHNYYRWNENTSFIDLNPFVFDA